MEISEKTVETWFYICVVTLILFAFLLITNFIWFVKGFYRTKIQTYHYLLVAINISSIVTVLSRIGHTIDMNSKFFLWLTHTANYSTLTVGILCELEILRLVSVLLPLFIQNHIIHLQIIAILLNAGIGGFNVLYGYLFVNLHEDNFGSKWAHSCIVIWYGGLGLYVTGQSTLVSRLIYLEYKKKRTVNHDTLNDVYKKVLYGILSLIILLILALLLLLCAMQIEKSAANFEFGHKLGIYLGGIDNCIQHCMLFVYQTIYPNTTKLCLSNVKKTIPKQHETLKM